MTDRKSVESLIKYLRGAIREDLLSDNGLHLSGEDDSRETKTVESFNSIDVIRKIRIPIRYGSGFILIENGSFIDKDGELVDIENLLGEVDIDCIKEVCDLYEWKESFPICRTLKLMINNRIID